MKILQKKVGVAELFLNLSKFAHAIKHGGPRPNILMMLFEITWSTTYYIILYVCVAEVGCASIRLDMLQFVSTPVRMTRLQLPKMCIT